MNGKVIRGGVIRDGFLIATLWASALMACGGGQQEAKSPENALAAGEKKPWAEKSREERMDFMGLEVFPKMKAAFSEYDAEAYAEFRCQTCHGDDMEAVDFKMPNSLYALSKENTLADAREYDAETTQFMTNVVLPEMAKLLGMKPYDPETHSGFGCFNCHPAAQD